MEMRIRQGVWDESPLLGSRGKVPVEVWETSLQKPAIFCKLYYIDVIWKKAKQ